MSIQRLKSCCCGALENNAECSSNSGGLGGLAKRNTDRGGLAERNTTRGGLAGL